MAMTEISASGFVYFFVTKNDEYVKIGISSKVDTRHKTIQTACPVKIAKVHHFFCDDPRGLETRLHTVFKDSRSHGEWFDPHDSEDLALLLAAIDQGSISSAEQIYRFIEMLGVSRKLADEFEEMMCSPAWENWDAPGFAAVLAMRASMPEHFSIYSKLTLGRNPHLAPKRSQQIVEDDDEEAA